MYGNYSIKSGENKKMNKNIDYWVIGFLWGSARISGDHLIVQNMDRRLLEKTKVRGNIKNKIYKINNTTSNKTSYRLKINLKNEYAKYMLSKGYEGRIGNEERIAPTSLNEKNQYDFLKGYFSTHYTLDRVKRNGKIVSRLRFYASENIIKLLNEHLHQEIDTSIKKIGNHKDSEICKILYYQSQKEVPLIIDYLKLEGN